MKQAILLTLLLTTPLWAIVNTTTTKVSFACNGSTTTFACTGANKIIAFTSADIEVWLRTTATGGQEQLTLTSDYTVAATNNNFTNGFTVTTNTAYASTYTLVVKRNLALTHDLNLIKGRNIPREGLERIIDRLVLMIQDLSEKADRATVVPVTDTAPSVELPSSVDRVSGYPYYGDDGTLTISSGVTSPSVTVSSFMETVVDDADADVAMATLQGIRVFNVQNAAYGAIPDDGLDDITAINAAITAADAADGGTVFLPAGQYETTSKIDLDGTRGVFLVGVAAKLAINEGPAAPRDRGTIINYTGTGFALRTGWAGAVRDLTIISADDGIELFGSNVVVDGCMILGDNTAGSIGVQWGGSLSTVSYGCVLNDSMVYNFKTMMRFDEYANGNYVYGSRMLNGPPYGECDYVYYFDSAITNYIHATVDCTVNSSNPAFYFTATGTVGCVGNEIRGYSETPGATNLVSFNHDNVSCYGNRIYTSGFAMTQQLNYDDIEYGDAKAGRNSVLFDAGWNKPSENFYHYTTENFIQNANFNHEPDGTTGIMPSGNWSSQSGGMTFSDDASTVYGYRAIKCTETAEGGIVYTVPATDLEAMKGRPTTFGAWVKTDNTVCRLTFSDGVESVSGINHDADDAWQYLELCCVVDASAASLTFSVYGNDPGAGWSMYVAAPTLAIGSKINETRPRAILDDNEIIYRPMIHNITTFPDEATPSVKCGSIFLTGGTTTITDLDDGLEGQVVTLIAEHSVTITDGTNFFLSGSANFEMTATDTLTLICKADNKWYEKSRGDNGA